MGVTGPPPQKDLGRDRLQGKLLEQELESQLDQRATGLLPQKEFDGRRLQGKNLEQEQESQRALPIRKNQIWRKGATRQVESGSKDSKSGLLHLRDPRQPHPKGL